MGFQSFYSGCFDLKLGILHPPLVTSGLVAFPFVAADVCVVCSGKLALELFLIVVIPLKEVLFIILKS